jgi:hypothetical protein
MSDVNNGIPVISDVKPDMAVEAVNDAGHQKKKIWRRPEVIRASADHTETGIFTGPEILVLLS